VAGASLGADLGGIRIHSRLNQPLTASIPIICAGEAIDENVKVHSPAMGLCGARAERLDFPVRSELAVESDRSSSPASVRWRER